MGFEQEAVSELYASVWGNRSTMQREFTRGAHGEQFVLRELSMKGTQTPSQLASALQASSGRISTVLSSLEKKGWVTRDIDSKDRRIIRVNLTDSGREQSHRMIEEMRSAICWIFSQMGERRTREFVDLVSEFTTYMSICHPGRPRPTAEQVREAFVERDKCVAEHMAAKRAEAERDQLPPAGGSLPPSLLRGDTSLVRGR